MPQTRGSYLEDFSCERVGSQTSERSLSDPDSSLSNSSTHTVAVSNAPGSHSFWHLTVGITVKTVYRKKHDVEMKLGIEMGLAKQNLPEVSPIQSLLPLCFSLVDQLIL